MITLNKLAKRCLETAMRKGKINNYTSRRAFILLISVKWRELLEASKYHSKHLCPAIQNRRLPLQVSSFPP